MDAMQDNALIGKIAERAAKLAEQRGMRQLAPFSARWSTFAVEVSDFHEKVIPLRLQDLLDADDFDFANDVFRIHEHYDHGSASPDFKPKFAVIGADAHTEKLHT